MIHSRIYNKYSVQKETPVYLEGTPNADSMLIFTDLLELDILVVPYNVNKKE